MRIDAYVSQPHYWTHVRPVWEALPAARRGRLYAHQRARVDAPGVLLRRPPRGGDTPILVAGWWDYRDAPGRRVALIEHGAGQPYAGTSHPAHPGGPRRSRVGLYLCPNDDVARRNLAAYPEARAAVVGAPHLDRWHRRPRQIAPDAPVVISWHWDSQVAPEARSAWPHYGTRPLEALRDALGGRLVGHAHPRHLDRFRSTYRDLGIPLIETFDEVLDAAPAVYVCDNSSTMYEAASIGIPVVAVNAPWYRRDVHHGLRFWSHVPGPQVNEPAELVPVVLDVLANPQEALASGQRAAAAAYVACDGDATVRAVHALCDWLDSLTGGPTRPCATADPPESSRSAPAARA